MVDDVFFGDQFVTCWFDFIKYLCDIELVNFEYPLNHAFFGIGLFKLAISLHVVLFKPLIHLSQESLIFNSCLRCVIHVLSETEAALDPYLNRSLQLVIEIKWSFFV